MKTVSNRLLFVLAAAATTLAPVFSSLHAAPPTSGGRELNVHGCLEAAETHAVTPPTMVVELEGVGTASHLGRFRLETEAVVFLPTFFGEGAFEIEMECGSRLFGTLTGQGSPVPGSDAVPVAETLTITGGTGRFCGASGTLATHRVLDRVTLVSTGTITGTVILPDPPKCRRRH
jgi:hypothetical protein